MSSLFNNLGFCSVAIAYAVEEAVAPVPISKALLVVPIISNRRLLDHLARKGVIVENIERLLVNYTECFANLNQRYYDSLSDSVNGIQFLLNIEVLELNDKGLQVLNPMPFHKDMGRRAQKAKQAAKNIASLLSLSSANLYSSLRIQI